MKNIISNNFSLNRGEVLFKNVGICYTSFVIMKTLQTLIMEEKLWNAKFQYTKTKNIQQRSLI